MDLGERHGRQIGCTALSEDKFPIQGAIEAYEDPFGKGLYMATFKEVSSFLKQMAWTTWVS